MPNSSPPPPPGATTPSPSKKRLLTCPKSNQGVQNISVSNCLPQKDKRTRDLPNLSDCHGCGLRINYSNPKDRLQPLESVWRIVLLCKKCIKLVNSGQLCPYCFRDTVNLVSDCVRCSDCERYIHKNCVVKYSNSAPWSYSCEESGLGFSLCVDCWVPKLLKNSVRICRRKEITEKCGEELCASNGDSRGLRKGKDGIISLADVVKDANSTVEKKIELAVEAKEKALRKAVVAKNAVLLASNALDLVARECSSKKSEGLVTSISNGSTVNEVTRFVDDAELAFRLHCAMNSSPRISKNTCSMNFSSPDLLKLTDSTSLTLKSNDLGSDEGGKVAVCSNTHANRNHDSNISEASACIRTNGSGSAISSPGLKPELKTYKRNSKKRKECQENVENGFVGTSFGVAGECTLGDDSRIITEPQSCQLDKLKQEFHVNDARTSSPESCNTNTVTENRSGNTSSDRYALKYSKRMAGCRRGLCKDVNFTHEGANSQSVSSQKETQASDPGLPMDCLMECRAFSDSSLHSCVVNLQTCASIGGSSQEEG